MKRTYISPTSAELEIINEGFLAGSGPDITIDKDDTGSTDFTNRESFGASLWSHGTEKK